MMVVVMHHVVMMMVHHVVMAVMRTGRGRTGRQGQHEGRRERQGDEFQGLSPGF